MSWSAALPGAAVRMPRTAAGWRALQVALLVGGVLAIGLLCGERAYAADGVRVLTHGTAGRIDSPGPRSVSGVGSAPLAGADAGAVGERVVRTAGDTGGVASQGLESAQPKEPPSSSSSSSPSPPLPKLPDLPDLPDLPALPKLPVLPDLPTPPELPVLRDLPGPPLPSHPLPTPATAGPQPVGTAPTPADAPVTVGRTGGAEAVAAKPDTVVRGAEHRAASSAEAVGHTSSAKPVGHTSSAKPLSHTSSAEHLGHIRSTDRVSRTRRADHVGPSSAHVGHGPGGQGAAGRSDGTLGNRSTADNSSPRHGDPHAVTLSHRARLRLLPGVAARFCAAGTRDNSHRDVPVFPG
ncbi:hypothetical protein AB0E64_12880 [Streptomyces caelestis]|uniref:Uncharacterized protein n=1 Tax=Streptomyces caelestis TaxID=36816 RepID=A0A7W9H7G4_9ACTN|nr:hypothetical protein [Streptomyces caelestis]MBB5797042.1 hypothetical protein [Streptomyces caelestis]GGW35387.1 hypothetical protein GCM10010320_13340 [Streptomyces caelestis]